MNPSFFIRDDLVLICEMFYLRHELGHILLHLNKSNTAIINRGKVEREANYFAFKLSKITFDEIELYEMSVSQICCSLELPYNALKNIINL